MADTGNLTARLAASLTAALESELALIDRVLVRAGRQIDALDAWLSRVLAGTGRCQCSGWPHIPECARSRQAREAGSR